MAELSLNRVSYLYNPKTESEVRALTDVTLSFPERKITGIIGHTGSGKSTLVELLNGLLRPTSGEVTLDGENVDGDWKKKYEKLLRYDREHGQKTNRRSLKKRAKIAAAEMRRTICFRVGLVMQYPEYQLFDETVEKDIGFGPGKMGLSDDDIRERVLESIRIVGLDESILAKSPFDLSGGQKRRVAIAGVLAMHPEVLVLDEPAAGLDPQGRMDIFDCIRRYRDELNATVVLVSHSMEDMASFCDHVVVMNRGQVVMQGTREEIFSRPDELVRMNLDVPQITRLMMMLREAGLQVPYGIYTVEDAIRAVSALFDVPGQTGGDADE